MDEMANELEPKSGGGVAMRLFVALPVARDVAALVADYADGISGLVPGSRPVEAEALHMTVAYLGNVAEELVPAIATALDDAASIVSGATACSVSGISVLSEGRVLALDVDVELLAMVNAARDRFVASVEAYAPAADWRAWRPHITMLRSRMGKRLPEALIDEMTMPPAATWIAPELQLFASLPSPMGRQHKLLHSSQLGAPVIG